MSKSTCLDGSLIDALLPFNKAKEAAFPLEPMASLASTFDGVYSTKDKFPPMEWASDLVRTCLFQSGKL